MLLTLSVALVGGMGTCEADPSQAQTASLGLAYLFGS